MTMTDDGNQVSQDKKVRQDGDMDGWDATVGDVVECHQATWEIGDFQIFLGTVKTNLPNKWQFVVEDANGGQFVRPRAKCRIVS